MVSDGEARMNEIEKKAIEIYRRNLSYLEKDHSSIHKKIVTLDSAISLGQYAEQYALEYKNEGYFDVKELATGIYLYNQNSKLHAEQMVSLIDTKREGAVFKALKYVCATKEQTEQIDKSELSFHNYLWALIKIINYCAKYASPQTFLRKVLKVIFLGTGLACHLEGICDNLYTQVLFIKEKNIELFRLSLFVTDYSILSQRRSLFFSIGEDYQEEQNAFVEFLNKGNNYNLHIKHVPFFDDYAADLKRLQEHVLSQDYINYGYSAKLLRYIDAPRYLVQEYNFINVSKLYSDNVLSQKPLLLLFSGPSTQKNKEWIEKNHHKFIVISALSTCRFLDSIGITPDIVLHIDPGDRTKLLFDGIDTNEYFKNTVVILASNVNEDTVSRFDRNQIHFIEQGTKYKKDFANLSAPSVGEYTYGLSLILGAREIYTLGIDLALDDKTLQSHGAYHFANDTGVVDDTSAALDPNLSVQYIKGNFKEKVPSAAGYKISIEQFAAFTQVLKKDFHQIYNLSDGAYLEGALPLRSDQVRVDKWSKIDKKKLFREINGFLKKVGSSEFRQEDKEIISYQLAEAKKLKRRITKFSKQKITNPDKFLQELSQLSWDLSDMENKTDSNLSEIYYEFFPIILSYIFDLFNTKNLDNPNKRVVEVAQILYKQLYKIVNTYITGIQRYTKQ